MSGKLTVIVGAMGSGKTEVFIRRINETNEKNIVFKPVTDTRSEFHEVVSRSGLSCEALAIGDGGGMTPWADAYANNGNKTTFFVDEAQFIHGLFDSVRYVQKLDFDVVVSALSSDYRNLPFGEIGELLAVADEIIHVPATCAICGGTATRSYRKTEVDDLIYVGGDESYEARCHNCWEK